MWDLVQFVVWRGAIGARDQEKTKTQSWWGKFGSDLTIILVPNIDSTTAGGDGGEWGELNKDKQRMGAYADIQGEDSKHNDLQ